MFCRMKTDTTRYKSTFQKRFYHFLQDELRRCGLVKYADTPELLLCCERAHDKMMEKK